jgi:hypothetical protein
MMVLIDYSRKLWKGSEASIANLPHVVDTIDELDQLDEFYENLAAECAEFETKPKRRKIMLFIDNYDAFTEESSRKNIAFFEKMSALVRKYQTAGVYMIVSGSLAITSATDDLRKIFTAPSFGIALKGADAVNRLNGKFPRSLAEVDLPMGRAFIVRSGMTSMLQLATPYTNDDDVDGSIDAWVRKIQERYPEKNVEWLRQPEEETEPSGNGEKPKSGKEKVKTAAGPKQPDLSKYNIAELKKKLLEGGLPEVLLGMLSEADIVEQARTMGLLGEAEEQK